MHRPTSVAIDNNIDPVYVILYCSHVSVSVCVCRYVPMLSVKLSSRQFCEPVARRFEHVLERFSCLRQLALPNCRLDPPTVVRLSRVLQLNTSLYSLDLADARLADDGAMLLAHALQRNSSLRMLALAGNELTSRGCRLIVRAIGRSRAVSELDLSDNRVGDVGSRALAELLAASNSALRRLSVCGNGLAAGGASALFAALRRNSRLTQLEVSRNGEIGDESSRELATALIYNRTLRHLAVSGCGLTTATCCVLARPLQSNSVLRVLAMDCNEGITDAGVEAVADSLRYNRSLRHLSFNRCGLTHRALTSLLPALYHNNTVRMIDVRPLNASSTTRQQPLPSNLTPAAAADDDDDDGSHGNVTASPTTELSRVLHANPLLRILY